MSELSEISSSRRWLIVFAIIISILVITTVSLVLLTKENRVTLLSEDTPQGIVQRYLIAVKEQNYQEAYNYLSFTPSHETETYDDWLRIIKGELQISNRTTWKATLGKTTQNSDNATVEVNIDTFHSGEPFADVMHSQRIFFQLIKIDNRWFVTSPTYIYWFY